MSSKHTIRNLKEDFDWEDYLDQHYSVKRSNGKNGQEIRICCPSCGDQKFKCYVNPGRSAFYCFKCPFRVGNGYDLFDFVAITEGITRGQALLRLLHEYKPTAPEGEDAPYHQEQESVHGDTLGGAGRQCPEVRFIDGLPVKTYKLEVEEGNPFWEYVKSRGFTEETLAATNLHYAPARFLPIYDSQDKFRGNLGRRIVFPVYGSEGQLVSWLGRSIGKVKPGDVEGADQQPQGKEPPKYFNCPESDLSKTLWPYSPPHGEAAILVEGIIDALGVRQVAGESSYATFGKRVSREQIQLLKFWGIKEVVLWYDKKDAFKEMVNEVERLKMHFNEVFVLDLSEWPEDKDPGSFLSDEEGVTMIGDTLNKKISVYSLEYARWKMSF